MRLFNEQGALKSKKLQIEVTRAMHYKLFDVTDLNDKLPGWTEKSFQRAGQESKRVIPSTFQTVVGEELLKEISRHAFLTENGPASK